MQKRVNYLNNRDILTEIHKSKCSYSSFTHPDYSFFDAIVDTFEDINEDVITAAKEARAKRLEIPVEDIADTDVVLRVMTYDHVPRDPLRKKNPSRESDNYKRLNFRPFQHWKYSPDGNHVCVGKSHWRGGLEEGYFCQTHGRITDKLAMMYLKLCERYAMRGNVRGYTYNDEMRSTAILQLVQEGLQFNEARSSNPFSYLTTVVTNSFLRVMQTEKKNQEIRDEILVMNDMNPSFTRIHNAEYVVEYKRNVTDYDGE